jgi:hypothetical protein
MTKGESYRIYYLKNRERILEANKERGKEAREKRREASEEDKEKQRNKDRIAFYQRRAKHIKDALLLRASEVEGAWKTVYETLATARNLADITKKQMDFLLTLRSDTPVITEPTVDERPQTQA